MKKLLTFATALTIMVAIAPKAHSIGAFLSYWNGKDTDNGYGAGINHQITIVPIVHGGLRASWLSYSDNDPGMNLFPLEALVRTKLGMFYVGAGVGYYIFSGKEDIDWDNAWGGFGLGGLEFTILKIGLFGELKYTWVETKITEPVESDVDGNGIGVNVGVIFNWF